MRFVADNVASLTDKIVAGKTMAVLLAGDKLKKIIGEGTVVSNADLGSIENLKYDFRMGGRVLKAALGQPVDLAEIPQDQRFIEPGEVVFVLTDESLHLPKNIMISLIPKRKMAHAGIHVLGGLAVDPLYQGVLLIGLYNFSSTRFPIQAHKKLIAAMFYELQSDEVDDAASMPSEITDFPDELIALIRSYKPVELNGLGDKVSELARELAALKMDILSDKDWQDNFKKSLDNHNQQIERLIGTLEMEIQSRTQEDSRLNSKLDSMAKSFWGLGLAKSIGVAIILLGLGAAVEYLRHKYLGV